MDHPNIMKIYEFYSQPHSYSIINELCPYGELFDEIIKNGPFDEDYSAYVMYQILNGVNYCHKMKVVHRDLKPENILIASKDKSTGYPLIKICDFGTSKFFEKNQIQKKTIGSSYYIAPEVLKKKYNEKCDLWSCGVIFYILLTQKPPFGGANDVEITQNVLVGKYDLNEENLKKCGQECIDLLKKLLTMDPNKRINAEKALEHPFFLLHKTKERYNDISDKKMIFNFISNLKSYKKTSVIQETALAYLVHNFNQQKDIVMAGRLFNQFDNSVDGKITKSELYNALKSRIGDNGSLKGEVESIFKNIDSDNNGFIEYEEFIRAAIDKSKFMDDRILKFAFRYFDKDNSGTIDFNEIKEVFEKTLAGNTNGKNVSQILKQIISEVDENNDGKISFDEFEIIMKKMLN
jgi:calcium-dependent protein kinase